MGFQVSVKEDEVAYKALCRLVQNVYQAYPMSEAERKLGMSSTTIHLLMKDGSCSRSTYLKCRKLNPSLPEFIRGRKNSVEPKPNMTQGKQLTLGLERTEQAPSAEAVLRLVGNVVYEDLVIISRATNKSIHEVAIQGLTWFAQEKCKGLLMLAKIQSEELSSMIDETFRVSKQVTDSEAKSEKE